jgi:TatD DNase family protein
LNISITGIVTFKNAKELHTVVREIPLENMMVETDAPYLAPDPYRGKRNEPSYVKFVAEKIAELKGISFEKVAEVTTANAKKLFKI